ncbi:NfeD family protein [Geminicoccaceae bacterium 1502E]|nr:NfeD family protein [Geminicoccaceae bacterium 1502E]
MSLEPWHWLTLAGLLALLEVAVPGFAVLWFAIAAAGTSLLALALPSLAWEWQVMAFAAAGVASAFAWTAWRRRHPQASDAAHLNRPLERLVGRRLQLSEAIRHGRGRVRAGDGSWPATGPDLPAGTEVLVTATREGTLVVEPATAPLDQEPSTR